MDKLAIKDNGYFLEACCPTCGLRTTKRHNGRFWEWQSVSQNPHDWNIEIEQDAPTPSPWDGDETAAELPY